MQGNYWEFNNEFYNTAELSIVIFMRIIIGSSTVFCMYNDKNLTYCGILMHKVD